MADSWEDEANSWEDEADKAAVAPVLLTDKWEGEDEDDVPDAWDAEEKKPAADAEAKKPEGEKAKSKNRRKQLAAAAEKKNLEAEEKRRLAAGEAAKPDDADADADASQAANLTPEELRRIQEESDLLVAKDTFGVDDAVPAHAIDPQKSIDLIQPVTKDDFDRLSKLLSQKLRQFESNLHYPAFVESAFRECSLELDSETLRKLSVMFNALATEKQKLQKASKGKKKGKVVVKVERDATGAVGGEDYDYDDYDDFM